MNGRKAKQRRRLAELAAEGQSQREDLNGAWSGPAAGHPLGEHAGAYVQWQKRMKAGLLSIMEENRKALGACTGEPYCPSSIHYPSCWAAR